VTGTTHPKTQVYISEDTKSHRHIYEDPKSRNHSDAIQVRFMNYILDKINFYQTPNYDTDWTNWTHEKWKKMQAKF